MLLGILLTIHVIVCIALIAVVLAAWDIYKRFKG